MEEERKPTYEELEAEAIELRPLKPLVEKLLLRIESLELQITKLEKIIFGLKSEKSGKNKKKMKNDLNPPPTT